MITLIKKEIEEMNTEICSYIEKVKEKTVILYPYNDQSIKLAKMMKNEMGIVVEYYCGKEKEVLESNVISLDDLKIMSSMNDIVIVLSEPTKTWFDDYSLLKTFGINDKQILNYEQIKYYIAIQENGYIEGFLEQIFKSGLDNLKFSRSYIILTNIEKCKSVYDLLEDTLSRKTYLRILCKNIMQCKFYFDLPQSKQYFDESVFKISDNESFWDVGGYDGDTIQQFVECCDGKYDSIVTFEPDKEMFVKLVSNSVQYKNIIYFNAGLCDNTGMMMFQKRKFGASRIVENDNNDNDISKIYGIKGDDIHLKPTYIKMDIEGAEKEALAGMKNTIQLFFPKMAICIYHEPEDIWEIPLMIKKISEKYHIAIRHHSYTSSETVCYAY